MEPVVRGGVPHAAALDEVPLGLVALGRPSTLPRSARRSCHDVGGDQGSAAFLKESDGIFGVGDAGVDRGGPLLEEIGDNSDTKRKRA
jgi:hypothetical protein